MSNLSEKIKTIYGELAILNASVKSITKSQKTFKKMGEKLKEVKTIKTEFKEKAKILKKASNLT